MSGESIAAAGDRPAFDTAHAWSRYWAGGALHSCPNAFDGNYAGKVRALWVEFFSALPAAARILDIGTGNGAVALIARDTGRALARAYYIEAIDSADIDPRAAAARHGLGADDIVFRSRTRCERTGCAPASFDAVAGQYALEYSDIEETARELSRILRPAGKALFVLHHADSPMLAAGRAQLEGFEWLRHKAPILIEARRGVRSIANVHRPISAARASRTLQQLVAQVAERGRLKAQLAFLEGIAAQVATALQEAAEGNAGAALQRLDVLSAEARAHEQRLRSMVGSAHTPESLAGVSATLGAAGLDTAAPDELRCNGDVLGWVLAAQNATAAR